VCGGSVRGKIDHEVLSWGKENLKGYIVIVLGWDHIVSLFDLNSKPRYRMAWHDSREGRGGIEIRTYCLQQGPTRTSNYYSGCDMYPSYGRCNERRISTASCGAELLGSIDFPPTYLLLSAEEKVHHQWPSGSPG
jgi:hypothetical protein